ncbi:MULTISPECIES: type IV toxin-antitoxin system YeeU family antitoxin [Citrobacter]|uniref:type IV toxin-antitoxin system YeeU family antitoxin n=1 Tax=Citrobacter TaxID=544 RepID=UPI0024497715|nr:MULTISPECIES: type IV toxin-antitoxin system YeeU family antitoxin [Citrobacter]MDH1409565.1 type IV toxin-antitoxin system YeeU family antitoxin [Citrobacter freundii]MDM3183261.1 type IV toxin-antitoxin system YeeU family antitoxin [Citrobacter sp. Cf098]
MNKDSTQTWGLKRDITPCFGARLVQGGQHLHFLADRAGFSDRFNEKQAQHLDEAFSHFIAHLELMLLSGELNPQYAHCVTLYRNGLTCEADTLGRHGYVYIAIYPSNQVKD